MGNLARLISINFTLARYGLDEIVLSLHFFRPLYLLGLINPFNWFRGNERSQAQRLRLAIEELGPIFIDRVVPVVVDAVAAFDDSRIPMEAGFRKLATPAHVNHWLRAHQGPTSARGGEPRAGEERPGTRKGRPPNAARLRLQEL